jgi:ribonuclease VapC
MTTYVLDSFALLAFFQNEPGADRVEELIDLSRSGDELVISSVNLGEVLYKSIRKRDMLNGQAILKECLDFPITVIPVDEELAIAAAIIKATTPISYADCIAAALSQRLGVTLVTGDPDFRKVTGALDVEWLDT